MRCIFCTIILGIIFSILSGITGEGPLRLDLNVATACYGHGDLARDFLNLQCKTSERITLYKVEHGGKLLNASCPAVLTANDTDIGDCCSIEPEDCRFRLDHNATYNYFRECSGHVSCSVRAGRERPPKSSDCEPNIHMDLSNYMLASFYCIHDASVYEVEGTHKASVDSIFLTHMSYPNNMTSHQYHSCVVYTSCESTITVTAVDIQIGCHQWIEISDMSNYLNLSCFSNNNYNIRAIHTSSSNVITFNISNPFDGIFGFYFHASSANDTLTVECGQSSITHDDFCSESVMDSSPVSVMESSPVSVMDSSVMDSSVMESSQVSVMESSQISVMYSYPVSVMDSSPVSVMDTSPVSVMDTSPVSVMDTSPVSVMDTSPVSAMESSMMDSSVMDCSSVYVMDSTPVSLMDSFEASIDLSSGFSSGSIDVSIHSSTVSILNMMPQTDTPGTYFLETSSTSAIIMYIDDISQTLVKSNSERTSKTPFMTEKTTEKFVTVPGGIYVTSSYGNMTGYDGATFTAFSASKENTASSQVLQSPEPSSQKPTLLSTQESLMTPVIAGVVAGMVMLALVAGAFVFLKKKKFSKTKVNPQTEQSLSDTDNTSPSNDQDHSNLIPTSGFLPPISQVAPLMTQQRPRLTLPPLSNSSNDVPIDLANTSAMSRLQSFGNSTVREFETFDRNPNVPHLPPILPEVTPIMNPDLITENEIGEKSKKKKKKKKKHKKEKREERLDEEDAGEESDRKKKKKKKHRQKEEKAQGDKDGIDPINASYINEEM